MRKSLAVGRLMSILLACAVLSATAAPRAGGIGAPRGEHFSLHTHRLHIVCRGEPSDSPVIVFESGLGGSADDWADVQHGLAPELRSCAYDRAGYGWSDPGPLPRTTTQIVSELDELLTLAGEQGPFILVGHSFGGLAIQEFAARHPARVAGLVLVDSSHPQQEERLGPLLTGARSTARNPVHMPDKSAGDDCRQPDMQSGFLNSRRKAVFAQMDELKNFAASAGSVARLERPTRLPAIVLRRGQREAPAGRTGDLAEQAWRELQADLAARYGADSPVIGERSGHNIHLCEPGLVVSAIAELASRLTPRP